MSTTVRDVTMLLTACLLYVAFTSGFGNACLLVERGWVATERAVALCSGPQNVAGTTGEWPRPRL